MVKPRVILWHCTRNVFVIGEHVWSENDDDFSFCSCNFFRFEQLANKWNVCKKWEYNQATPSGAKVHSVVIHNKDDLMRLRRAVALKHLVKMNGGSTSLSLDTFRVGQYMMIPNIDASQVHIIDESVAKYFYQTEHYYAATLQEIKQGIDALEDALSRPEIQPLLVD